MLAFVIALLSITACLSNADILTLKDGTVYEGVITKETRAQVVIEITIANIKTTKTFARYKVKSIEHKPVETAQDATDQVDTDDKVDSDDTTNTPRTTDRPRRNTARKRTPRPSADSLNNYIIVPIKGTIGEETNSNGLKKTLQLASRKRIKHIVFVIDSPGGYVYDAVETLKVLKEYDDALVYHALVEEGAISAASVYVAAADDIFVRPGARVGGAVAYTNDKTNNAKEVDAKFNSIWAAEIAARAESKGYPAEIFRAMVVLDAEVWMNKEGEITSTRPTGRTGAQQIDSRRTILTIRAAQMVQAGMAKEFTGNIKELGEALDLTDWVEVSGIGSRSMIQSAKERTSLREKMVFAQDVFTTSLEDYKAHHPSTYTDYLRYIIRNDPYDRYGYNDRNNNRNNDTVAQDAESVRKWKERSREALNDVDIMLDALKEMAKINKKAERAGALHLVMSEKLGDDRYRSTSRYREWLVANLNLIPFQDDGTIRSPPKAP